MTNTIIQIKRSADTAAPTNGSLSVGELAYSYNTERLFIGNVAGSGVDIVGGRVAYELANTATSANTASTLMKRDADGEVAVTTVHGNLRGRANTAQALTPGRYIALTGDATANTLFDGTQNIQLTVDLSDTGVSPGTYGSAGAVPQIVVDAEGRITSASNVGLAAASFGIRADSGSDDTLEGGDILHFIGGDGIDTSLANTTGFSNVTIAVDSTVVRTTGDQTIGGNKTFSGGVTIFSGNVIINGETIYANTTHLNIGDNILTLNADLPIGTSPSQDAGIEVNRGDANANARIYWDETNDWWTAVSNVILSGASALGRIHTDSYANATALTTGTVPSARIAGSYTGITGVGTIAAGTWQGSNVAVAFGGTGRASHTLNGVLLGNTAGDIKSTAAPTEGQVLQGNASGVPVFAMLSGGEF